MLQLQVRHRRTALVEFTPSCINGLLHRGQRAFDASLSELTAVGYPAERQHQSSSPSDDSVETHFSLPVSIEIIFIPDSALQDLPDYLEGMT